MYQITHGRQQLVDEDCAKLRDCRVLIGRLISDPAEVRLSMEPELPVNELERPNVTLNCQVVSGFPPVLLGVRWYLDGELLKELPDCPLNDTITSFSMYDEDLCDVDPSKLLLEYVGRSFQGNYSCEGMNAAGWGPPSDVETLVIYCT